MPMASPETTDLERRVFAHERILQALIAYMARTDPRFIDHLRARFVEPMSMARHEHDHRETDDYADEFFRAVMRLGEVRTPKSKEQDVSDKQPEPPGSEGASLEDDGDNPGRRKRRHAFKIGNTVAIARPQCSGTDLMSDKAMAEGATPYNATVRTRRDVPQERQCLRCEILFWSEGFGERICRRCKGLNAWRNAVPVSSGSSRRR